MEDKLLNKKREFYTKSGRKISYYGDLYGYIPVINNIYPDIKTLDDLFEKLLLCYGEDTTYPSCKMDYKYDNDPTYGQCAITAMIVNDVFKGTIHKIKVEGGGTHYFNKIEGHYIDLTNDQFDLYNIPIFYEPNEEIPRERLGTSSNTQKRYEILKERLSYGYKNKK